jgi:hypothetical protein
VLSRSHRRALAFGVAMLLAAGGGALALRSRAPRPAARASHARFSLTDIGAGLPHAGQWREGFALADLDGDGRLDLVHGPPRKGGGPPRIFLFDGHGFKRWTAATFPPLPYDYGDVAVADFNGDGHLDLALAIHLRGLLVLAGDGHGRFSAWSEGLPLGPAAFSSRALAAVDWDRDGTPDLVALSDGPRPYRGAAGKAALGLRIFLNRHGTWAELDGDNPANTGFGDAVVVGDVDGDGAPDALAASSVVGARTLLHLGGGARRSIAELAELPPRALVRAVALGDFDGDGRPDLAVATRHPGPGGWVSGIDLLYRRGGRFERRGVLTLGGGHEIVALATGDLDGDGRRDLGALRDDGALLLFAGDGHGFVTPDLELPAPAWRAGCRGSRLRFADLDGDGRDEIVASFGDEHEGAGATGCGSGGGLAAWRVTARPARR